MPQLGFFFSPRVEGRGDAVRLGTGGDKTGLEGFEGGNLCAHGGSSPLIGREELLEAGFMIVSCVSKSSRAWRKVSN